MRCSAWFLSGLVLALAGCTELLPGNVPFPGDDSGASDSGIAPDAGDASTDAAGDDAGVVNPGPRVQAITAGADHTCALTTSGEVICWGNGDRGQLGRLPVDDAGPYTVAHPDGIRVAQICAGHYFGCMLDANATVLCWGNGDSGQLGSGAASGDSSTPIRVPLSADAREVACGNVHACARTAKGIECWGSNSVGQVGAGSNTGIHPPTTVAISAASLGVGVNHTCSADTRTSCWGINGVNQVTGRPASPVFVPAGSADETGALRGAQDTFGMGAQYTCGIGSTRVTCWGAGAAVAEAPTSAGWEDIEGGPTHVCARMGGGLRCWGANGESQLGTSAAVDVYVVSLPLGVRQTPRSFSAGLRHTCAIDADDRVHCWGANGRGQANPRSSDATLNVPTAVSVAPLVP